MYDVINVTLCHSRSKLNPQKNGLTGPYPTTYILTRILTRKIQLEILTRIPTRQIGILVNILF